MLVDIPRLPRIDLSLEEYLEDFWSRYRRMGDASDFWKLERRQTFREPGNTSWEQFSIGNWDAAVELMADIPETTIKEFAADGCRHRRIRVVQLPVSSYVHWELHVLLHRATTGERTRILTPQDVSDLETPERLLPEIVLLGRDALYEVIYSGDGEPVGAGRIDDPTVISGAHDELGRLARRGRNLPEFFEREIRHLPPPVHVEPDPDGDGDLSG